MIAITGIAGSGKSVQGSLLAKRLNCQWISVGQLLKSSVTGQDKEDVLEGKLLSDEVVNNTVEKVVSGNNIQYIVDGYPRTVGQAQWLVEQNTNHKLKLNCIVHLVVDENEVIKRLLSRNREDDTEPAIRQRFKQYNQDIDEILNIFKTNGIDVIDINGNQTIEKVQQDIISSVSKDL